MAAPDGGGGFHGTGIGRGSEKEIMNYTIIQRQPGVDQATLGRPDAPQEPRRKPDPWAEGPIPWMCPGCGGAYLTPELQPRCATCGFRERP